MPGAAAAGPSPPTLFSEDACALFCQALYFGDGERTLGWESWDAAVAMGGRVIQAPLKLCFVSNYPYKIY